MLVTLLEHCTTIYASEFVFEFEIFIVLLRVKVNTQVEVYEEPSILKEVVGGVIGGLLIISLITAALYKVQYTSLFITL